MTPIVSGLIVTFCMLVIVARHELGTDISPDQRRWGDGQADFTLWMNQQLPLFNKNPFVPIPMYIRM